MRMVGVDISKGVKREIESVFDPIEKVWIIEKEIVTFTDIDGPDSSRRFYKIPSHNNFIIMDEVDELPSDFLESFHKISRKVLNDSIKAKIAIASTLPSVSELAEKTMFRQPPSYLKNFIGCLGEPYETKKETTVKKITVAKAIRDDEGSLKDVENVKEFRGIDKMQAVFRYMKENKIEDTKHIVFYQSNESWEDTE